MCCLDRKKVLRKYVVSDLKNNPREEIKKKIKPVILSLYFVIIYNLKLPDANMVYLLTDRFSLSHDLLYNIHIYLCRL